MTDTTAPNHLNLAAQLSAGAYHYLMHTLRETLPDLLTNNPEDIALRDQSAMGRVAALCPANIAEAEVAALHVVHAEHAKACLRDSKNPTIALLGALKCRAQAASMARQADGSLRMLLRMQAARQKTEANPEARDRAAWTEHCALNLMAQALSPPPTAEPSPPPPPKPEPVTLSPSPCGRGQGEGTFPVRPERETEPAARSPSPRGRIEPRSGSMRESAVPMTHHASNNAKPVCPQSKAPIRQVEHFTHLPDEDLIKALITALNPASVPKHDQPAEVAEA